MEKKRSANISGSRRLPANYFMGKDQTSQSSTVGLMRFTINTNALPLNGKVSFVAVKTGLIPLPSYKYTYHSGYRFIISFYGRLQLSFCLTSFRSRALTSSCLEVSSKERFQFAQQNVSEHIRRLDRLVMRS